MVKCVKCGTGWTSSGLPLCPVCGTKVETPAAAAPPEIRKVDAHPYIPLSLQAGSVAPQPARQNGGVVVEVARPAQKKTEVRLPPRPEPFIFKALPKKDPAPPPQEVPPEAKKTEIRIPPGPAADPPKPAPAAPMIAKEKPVEIELPATPNVEQVIDASAVYPAFKPGKFLRTSSRPLNAPIILGCLAYVAVLMLPLTMAFESNRVVGILGFTLAGFFAPFAPIAWMVGLSAEQRRRDQELLAERRVTLGRLLGQWGTLLLVIETTIGLIAIAALRLSSKFPASFWRGEF